MTKRERINPADIVGNKYGRLTVINYAGLDKRNLKLFECKCDCGTIKTFFYSNLRQGFSKSCGCLQREMVTKHGGAKGNEGRTRLYRIWFNMKDRCFNINGNKYRQWGARGIIVCDEWRNDFAAFRDWALQNGYNDKLSIDRIDVNGNYEPSNCKWATSKEQNRNRRNTVFVTYNGVEAPLSEWTERLGLPYSATAQRIIKLGWSVEKAFSVPVRKKAKAGA